MDFITFQEMLLRITAALLFGTAIGTERIIAHKTAGMRTYGLVAMGAALFIVISQQVSTSYLGITDFDPLRVASQIVVGVGFLGGGLIIFQKEQNTVRNLTTAAGLWIAAAVGMATGFGFYSLAAFATLLTLLVFTFLWIVEQKIKKIASQFEGEDLDPDDGEIRID